jgi:hypothetical protein
MLTCKSEEHGKVVSNSVDYCPAYWIHEDLKY